MKMRLRVSIVIYTQNNVHPIIAENENFTISLLYIITKHNITYERINA